jgi:D-alanine-D-alanine ligase
MRPSIAIIWNEEDQPLQANGREDVAIVSVKYTVSAVEQALATLGFQPLLTPLSQPIEDAIKVIHGIKAPLVFNLFEGFGGLPETEIEAAHALNDLGVPYTGNPPTVLSLGLDKVQAKECFNKFDIPTPAFQVFDSCSLQDFNLKFPVIAKPSREDASHGIYSDNVANDISALESVIRRLLGTSKSPVLVEEYIDGKEFNITVLGVHVLPISEIVYSLPSELPSILTYESKWDPESIYFKHTQVKCPARISHTEEKKIKELAIRAFKACGCKGYGRVDIRQDSNGNYYVLEINPNPDISPDAGCARQASAVGLTYTELIKIIIEQSLD